MTAPSPSQKLAAVTNRRGMGEPLDLLSRLPQEGSPAVPDKAAEAEAQNTGTPRPFRLNTNITQDHGDLLERMTLHLRQVEGRKHRHNHTLELAIGLLAKQLGMSTER